MESSWNVPHTVTFISSKNRNWFQIIMSNLLKFNSETKSVLLNQSK